MTYTSKTAVVFLLVRILVICFYEFWVQAGENSKPVLVWSDRWVFSGDCDGLSRFL